MLFEDGRQGHHLGQRGLPGSVQAATGPSSAPGAAGLPQVRGQPASRSVRDDRQAQHAATSAAGAGTMIKPA
jgi:hypothetical protein